MDDSEIFNRNIILQVFESAGLFVFQGLSPGSLAEGMLEDLPIDVLMKRAHAILSQEVVDDTRLVISRCTPNVVKQNLSTWKGLWNESEVHKMQWKLEANEATNRWEKTTKELVEHRAKPLPGGKGKWYNTSVV